MGVCGAFFPLRAYLILVIGSLCMYRYVLSVKEHKTLRAVYMKYYSLLVNINKYILLNNLLAILPEITRIQTWPSYKLCLYFLFRIPNYIFSSVRKSLLHVARL